ncbi:lactoylglutathione lyase [Elstera litoralis]|uniref:Lactoylglutathione lyase n=1 Tax=Elstera litoralis TaxID=552518 RepID=A0A0F3IWT4_9PROT|nr:VOC family protein [Elstera litoralis]KJV11141.1 lactoylglutathione lyase [Elstera litoralis]
MTAYITLGANDCGQSNAFYDAVLPTIGWAQHAEFPGWRAYSEAGRGDGLTLWVAKPFNQAAATAGNGTMVGFMVTSHAEVDAFHAAILANGGQDEGAPGFRPQYGPTWYAAYGRDPVGNKLAVVCNQ